MPSEVTRSGSNMQGERLHNDDRAKPIRSMKSTLPGSSSWLVLACSCFALFLAVYFTPALSGRSPLSSLKTRVPSLTNSTVSDNSLGALFEIQLDSIVEGALQDRVLDETDDIAAVAHHIRTLRKLSKLLPTDAEGVISVSHDSNEYDLAVHRAIVDISQHVFQWMFPTLQYQTILEVHEQTKKGGRGIVIPVGRLYVRWAGHLISTIRKVHKCDLPIEIVYAGGQDLPLPARTYLTSLGEDIYFLDIKGRYNERLVEMPGGWAIKPFSILASRFSEVILIDADVIFFESPEMGFEYEGYKETGSLFFRDRQIWEPDEANLKWVQALIRRSDQRNEVQETSAFFRRNTAHEMESGVVYLDKYKNFYALLLMCHMNQKIKRDDLIYKMFHGEKESYWLAMAATSHPFAYAEGYAGAMGLSYLTSSENPADPGDADRICTRSILHSTTRNGTRPWWFNGSIVKHKDPGSALYNGVEAWSVGPDGRWDSSEWAETGTGCFIQTTPGAIREFSVETTEKFNALIQCTIRVDVGIAETLLALD